MYHFGTFSGVPNKPPSMKNRQRQPTRRVEKIETEWRPTFSAIPRKSSISGETIWGSMYKKSSYTKIGIYLGETEITNQIWKDKHIRAVQRLAEAKSRVRSYATGKEIFESKLKGEA